MSKKHNQNKKHWRAKFHRPTSTGLPPGTLVVDPEAQHPVIQLIAFNNEKATECLISDTKMIKDYLGTWTTVWVSVIGLGDIKIIRELGEIFDIHSLALEDILNVHQRPKAEAYNKHLFIVAQLASGDDKFQTEQVGIFVGNNFVLSFQEQGDDAFKSISESIFRGQGKIKQLGAGYLTYCLLDNLVDSYFPILETYGERLEDLEDEIITSPHKTTIAHIHEIKRDLLVMRKSIWPVRDLINFLYRENTDIFSREVDIYLRDCSDHAIRIVELIETYRELSGDLLDVYLSSLSNRMNEVMRLLAIITTIFVPPTFITGVYGMNFVKGHSPINYPLIEWVFGLPFIMTLIMIAFIITLSFLSWKKMLIPSDHDHS